MNNLSKPQRLIFLVLALSLFGANKIAALTIDSVIISPASNPSKIIVLGVGLTNASFQIAGTVIPSSCVDNVSDNIQHISFCSEAAFAVPSLGSYNLQVNGTVIFTFYIGHAIIAPPVSPECPCTSGWQNPAYWSGSIVPSPSSAWCLWGTDNAQKFIYKDRWIDGSGRPDFFAAAFDPNNIFFDPVNVGNSLSYCALHDGSSYTVAEPVVSWEQYDDCVLKLFQYFCL